MYRLGVVKSKDLAFYELVNNFIFCLVYYKGGFLLKVTVGDRTISSIVLEKPLGKLNLKRTKLLYENNRYVLFVATDKDYLVYEFKVNEELDFELVKSDKYKESYCYFVTIVSYKKDIYFVYKDNKGYRENIVLMTFDSEGDVKDKINITDDVVHYEDLKDILVIDATIFAVYEDHLNIKDKRIINLKEDNITRVTHLHDKTLAMLTNSNIFVIDLNEKKTVKSFNVKNGFNISFNREKFDIIMS